MVELAEGTGEGEPSPPRTADQVGARAIALRRGARIERNGGTGNAAPWVFPSPGGDQPIHRNALGVALRRNRKYLGLDPFSPHDLRRTYSDWMARLKVDGRHRSAVLNHREAGVTEANYTVYSYDAEKKAALEKWARKLKEIITGKKAGKVVSIG